MTGAAALLVSAALAGGTAHAVVAPSSQQPDGQVRVEVTGVRAPAASVHIVGGLASGGRWFSWVALRPDGPGAWWTILRAPGFYGVYPVSVRAGGRVVRTDGLVQILPGGFARRPAFATPQQVAEWWARVVPPGATLRSVQTWHSGFFTHRDATLNRLLRVTADLHGPWRPLRPHGGAVTVFLSIARLTTAGGWRLLETTTSP